MCQNFFTLLLAFQLANSALAQDNQGVSIGAPAPNPYAMLDVVKDDKGILIPRMSAVQIAALTTQMQLGGNGPTSLLLFNSDQLYFQFWNNTSSSWIPLTDTQDLTAATLSGTTLNIDIENGDSVNVDLSPLQDHDFYVAGTTVQSDNITNDIYTNGKVGIGVDAPTNQLHVVSLDGNDAVRIEGLQDGTLSYDVVVTSNNGELKKMDSDKYVRAVCPFTPPDFFSYFNIVQSDGQFTDNGPLFNGSVSLDWDENQIFYSINITETETDSDWSIAEIDVNYIVYKPPSGYDIYQVYNGTNTSLTYEDCDDDPDVFNFNETKLVRNWTLMGRTSDTDVSPLDALYCDELSYARIVFNSITVIIGPEL